MTQHHVCFGKSSITSYTFVLIQYQILDVSYFEILLNIIILTSQPNQDKYCLQYIYFLLSIKGTCVMNDRFSQGPFTTTAGVYFFVTTWDCKSFVTSDSHLILPPRKWLNPKNRIEMKRTNQLNHTSICLVFKMSVVLAFSRWWFQACLIFIPILGRFPI